MLFSQGPHSKQEDVSKMLQFLNIMGRRTTPSGRTVTQAERKKKSATFHLQRPRAAHALSSDQFTSSSPIISKPLPKSPNISQTLSITPNPQIDKTFLIFPSNIFHHILRKKYRRDLKKIKKNGLFKPAFYCKFDLHNLYDLHDSHNLKHLYVTYQLELR